MFSTVSSCRMSGWAVAIFLLPTYGFAFFRNGPFVPSTPRSFSLATRLSTAKATPGDVATIDLSILLEDGTAMPADFDTGSQVRFRLGRGGLPPYVHAAVEGMHVQERRTRSVPPDEAYGPYYPELAADIPAENTPPGMKVGDKVKLSNGLTARVTRHDPAQGLFSLDGNHPFAGRTLSLSLLLHDLMPADSPCFATVHLAAGCFWGLELAFQRLPGVVATAAGYTQGGNEGEGEERRAPTYSEVCSGRTGYVEAVEVLFDEGVVSFEKILEVFWNRHDPTQLNGQGNDLGTQYRGGIYYTSDAQKRAAEESKARLEASGLYDKPIVTEILPADIFYTAEEYHLQ